MTTKVLMIPHPSTTENTSGIGQVIYHYAKYLPEFDVELVSPDATTYDIKVGHAGAAEDADVVHSHGIYWSADYEASDMEWKSNVHVINALRHAKEVTVPSNWVAEAFQRDMRFTPYVVPHGIEWDEWQHSLPSQEYVLWNKNRTADVCTNDVLTILAKAFPTVQFVTTFAPPETTPNIRVIGRVPHAEMKTYVQQAQVYLANVKETFGIGILEAMASGVPVLGYAHGGILDLVQHKVSGYLAKPDDLEELIIGLKYCYEHRDELGAAGREIAKRFSWRNTVQQVAKVYELAQRPEPATCAIIIPSYNYSGKVSGAIQSAMVQTYPMLTDIVVVDDGSPDNDATRNIVQSFMQRDSRIRYIRQTNMGVAHARNNGIASVYTKYVCPLDADDQIAPNFLAELIPSLEADRSLGITYAGITLVHPDGKRSIGKWPGKFDYDAQLRKQNQIPTCCVMRRDMWQRLGGYRQRYAPIGAGSEDAEFWLRCGAYGWNAKQVTEDPLFIYSFQSGYVSGNRHYHEVDWTTWHPWVDDGQHPFASVATPVHFSHPVRQYDEPLISIIIPVGPGHAHLLIDALDSCEAQSFRKWEAIVVNDTDEPLDLTAYPYVRLVETSGRCGAGYARNRGIEITRADLFLCLDADDWLQPECLHTMYLAYLDSPDSWVYSDMYIIKDTGIIERYNTKDWEIHELVRNGIAPVTCLYIKDQWDEVGGYDEQSTREDWDFHLRLAQSGFCGQHISRPLFSYRHATGQRRDEGSRKREIEKLHRIYSERQMEDMCKGCGKKRNRAQKVPTPIPEGWQMKDNAEGVVEVEYTGEAKSQLTFRGKSARHIYRFSADPRHRVKQVLASDAEVLLKLSYFRKVDPKVGPIHNAEMLQAEPTPKAPPVVEEVKLPEPKVILPMPKLEPEPTPEVKSVEPMSEPETVVEAKPVPVEDKPKSDGRPDISVPDITTMTIAEMKSYHGKITSADAWRAMLYDEQHRDDGVPPRQLVIDYCEKRVAHPVWGGATPA